MDGSSTPALMPDGSQAYGVDDPHYLGPVISATKDKPVRIVFYNLLPTGAEGDLFLPTDSSMMGSGMGPMNMAAPVDQGTVTDGVRNPACTEYPKDATGCFKDNRATLHLHGGVTPWISDGTPHQWITPASEDDSLASWCQRAERARHGRRAEAGERAGLLGCEERLRDVLLHQPAVGAADVLPRPLVGDHPPERVRRRGGRLPDQRSDRDRSWSPTGPSRPIRSR